MSPTYVGNRIFWVGIIIFMTELLLVDVLGKLICFVWVLKG